MRLTRTLSLRTLYIHSLGAVALAATTSFWAQLSALSSSSGLVPASETFATWRSQGQGFLEHPTWLWFNASDAALHATAAVAVLASLGLVLGLAPRLLLALLWASWLSLVNACGPWLWFQWDALLVECAFMSIPFAPAGSGTARRSQAAAASGSIEAPPSRLAVFLLRWLAFKVTFGDAVVKLVSSDPSWGDLTALTYHFWTQPLPSSTSALLGALPKESLTWLCGALLGLGVTLPMMQWGPRPVRLSAALGLTFFHGTHFLSGNTNTSHLLPLVLVIPLLDDAALYALMPSRLRGALPPAEPGHAPPQKWRAPAVVAAVAVVLLGCTAFLGRLTPRGPVAVAARALRPLATINGYGGFAHMTKQRHEILIEGSDDGERWHAYELPVKPGRVDRRPPLVAPWQPRLDWQLWFAALADCERAPWLTVLLDKLLEGDALARSLLAEDPFEGRAPRFVRAQRYNYRPAPLRAPGVWWERELIGPYCPARARGAGR